MRRIAVVLAGGKGERFWPLSRPERPKQFLRLLGGKSLLQATYERLGPLFPEIWVVTTEALAPLVREHLPGLSGGALLLEPEGKDTASAIALALIRAEEEGVGASRSALKGLRSREHETVLAFFPSDHWNSGILIASTPLLREEFLSHAPEVYPPLKEKGVSAYPGLPKKSVDYALLEKSNRVYMLKASFLWDDLGDWTALERLFPEENVVVARHLGLDTRGSILYSTGEDLIVTIGVEDLVIVRDGEVTLIARKDRVQDLKKVLEELKLHPELKDAL